MTSSEPCGLLIVLFITPEKDSFIEECELIRADLLEQELVVDGQFVTEDTMQEWGWSECLVSSYFSLESTTGFDLKQNTS